MRLIVQRLRLADAKLSSLALTERGFLLIGPDQGPETRITRITGDRGVRLGVPLCPSLLRSLIGRKLRLLLHGWLGRPRLDAARGHLGSALQSEW